MLTVKEVVEITGIPLSTVSLYCRTKKFPNARKKSTQFGDFWVIPETDLSNIEKRKPGRPKTKTVERELKENS